MNKISGANYLVDALVQTGAKRIWGVTGDSLNGSNYSLLQSRKIRWMHVRHEEVGACIAGSEAAVTGKIAVCDESAFDQRAARLPAQTGADARYRVAHTLFRDWAALFPRGPSAKAIS